MKTIAAALLTAQRLASRTPYIYMIFTSTDGLTAYDYSSDKAGRRILLIDHTEQPFGIDGAGNLYGDTATIVLRNDDRTIPDLRGYRTSIGYGDVYGGGASKDFSLSPVLWVKHQQTVSAEGKLYDVLELEGCWQYLHEQLLRLGDPPYYVEKYNATLTVYELIQYILSQMAGFSILPIASSDGIIDVYKPILNVNLSEGAFESAAVVMQALMNMTNSYLMLTGTGFKQFEVVYPQSTDTPDATYSIDGNDKFLQYIKRGNLVVPNTIKVFAGATLDADGNFVEWPPPADIITGTATNAESVAMYGEVIGIEIAKLIQTQTDADNRAAVVLARGIAGQVANKILAPHDCRVELFDYIEVSDTR